MSTVRKTTSAITVILTLLCLTSLAYCQQALDQLNAQVPTSAAVQTGDKPKEQNSSDTKISSTEAANNEDKIKATMSSEEYQHYQSAKAYVDQNSKYTLGPEDIVNIIVMRHPEVSGEYTINKEGKIQYEFVGDVQVAGLTKEQAVEILTKKLSVYIVKPEITFKISGYNSKIVFVVGEVGIPGKIFMHGDTITIRDALLSAGLPLLTASTDNASWFTPSDSGKVVRKKVNVDALLYKGDLRENYVMKPGDTLYLPATFWAKATRAISPILNPIGQAAGTAGAGKAAAL
ncbi:MAG: polysaccharide export protein [Candidatus Omnitrophica bacterium]|nr:polysaccharide export protein [Candidatus Omnitrophota bacterium]